MRSRTQKVTVVGAMVKATKLPPGRQRRRAAAAIAPTIAAATTIPKRTRAQKKRERKRRVRAEKWYSASRWIRVVRAWWERLSSCGRGGGRRSSSTADNSTSTPLNDENDGSVKRARVVVDASGDEAGLVVRRLEVTVEELRRRVEELEKTHVVKRVGLEEAPPPPPGASAATSAATSDPRVEKYARMKRMGVPDGAVRQAMIKDGVDPKLMGLEPVDACVKLAAPTRMVVAATPKTPAASAATTTTTKPMVITLDAIQSTRAGLRKTPARPHMLVRRSSPSSAASASKESGSAPRVRAFGVRNTNVPPGAAPKSALRSPSTARSNGEFLQLMLARKFENAMGSPLA